MLSKTAVDRAVAAFAEALEEVAEFAEQGEVNLRVEMEGQHWCYRLVCHKEGDQTVCRRESVPC